jgi:hypothetical protein
MEINMGTELELMNDELSNFVTAFDAGDEEALMKMSGQADSDSTPKMGLPRLTINYETETDEGITLKRGAWRIWNGSAIAYADTVNIRPLMRTYEWSVWNQEEGKFTAKSVQRPSLNGEFPDSAGGNKCGRLSRQEEESMAADDPRVLLSRSVNCNQVIYGVIDAPDATLADGTPSPIEAMPFVSYFKRSGFRPVREFIDQNLTRKKILMQKAVIELTTEKQKNGGVVYWTPKLSLVKEVSITDNDKELIKQFAETVKGHNETVMNDYRDAQKAQMASADVDLSQRFAS